MNNKELTLKKLEMSNEGYFAQCVEDKKRACEEAGFGDVARQVKWLM